ncbi:MAG: TetR/AcrR family transcriptional regulator [Mycobacteriaceae bacterium]|nr:TetR/AcrR family transcriptional regulator [Mycobacteriaceae bacterium]
MPRTGRPRAFDDGQVVLGARDVFWQRGYAATSMRELKENLGVFPGSLYGAFGDKHALFLRALERYSDDTRTAAAALAAPGPWLPRIAEMLLDVLTAAEAAPGRGCMLGNTAAELLPQDHAAGRVVREAYGALEQAITAALSRAQAAGEVRADVDCAVQGRVLLVLMQGLHIVARAEPDPRRLQDVIHAALATVAN